MDWLFYSQGSNVAYYPWTWTLLSLQVPFTSSKTLIVLLCTSLFIYMFVPSMHCDPEQGLMYFILFKASHPVKAYEKAKEIMVYNVHHSKR